MAAQPPVALARRRLVIAAGLVGALAAISLLVVAVLADRKESSMPANRADRLADLLAWIPAGDPATPSFVAWTPDPGEPAQTTALDAWPSYATLGLDPIPAAVGGDPDAAELLGWSAVDVTGWATDGEVTVLTGGFDREEIAKRLAEAGYRGNSYRGFRMYLVRDGATLGTNAAAPILRAIGAVAVSADRIVTAISGDHLRRAIDVAYAGAGSLADQPVISAAIASLAPINILTGVTQSAQAAECDPKTVDASTAPTGRDNYVLVGYGRLGVGGERRTLVAVSYPSEAAAGANLAAFADGWQGGFVNARGAGASIAAYGEVSDVSQTGRLLVAELIHGRDDGWVRAGIRFALPVCAAAMTLAPAATPNPTGGGSTTMERLSNGLPSADGPGERFRAVDLRGLAAARGATAPDAGADAAAVTPWLGVLRPLPAMAVLPDDPAQLAAWSRVMDIPLAAVAGMAEFERGAGAATVGLVIGTWDEAALTNHLTAIGYQTIVIGDVRHFAIDPSPADAFPFLSTHPIWRNIALLGDRMWVAADQRTLRAVLARATDPTRVTVTSSTALRPFQPADLAVQSEGAAALADRCGTIMAGAAGFAVAIAEDAGGTTARLVLLLDGTVPAADATAALEGRLASLTIPVPSVSDEPANGSPVPTSVAQLTEVVALLDVEDASANSPPAVVAQFALTPDQRPGTRFLFAALLEGCRLTGLG